MTAPVVCDYAESLLRKEMQLTIPCVGIQWPSMRKRDSRALAPIFVVNRCAVFHRHRAHLTFLLRSTRICSSHFADYLVGINTGAPLSFTRNTTNFAGSVLLALRPTT